MPKGKAFVRTERTQTCFKNKNEGELESERPTKCWSMGSYNPSKVHRLVDSDQSHGIASLIFLAGPYRAYKRRSYS